jgi:hypothetical protein
MTSGPVIRNKLKRSGFPEHKNYWKYFAMKANTLFGVGAWRLTPAGILVSGRIAVNAEDYQAWLENRPKAPLQTQKMDSDDDGEKPTFTCDQCNYAGYTKAALAAHKRRMDH